MVVLAVELSTIYLMGLVLTDGNRRTRVESNDQFDTIVNPMTKTVGVKYNSHRNAESKDARTVREAAQLLDACGPCTNMNEVDAAKVESQEKILIPTISERFMGMRAAMVTNHSSLMSFGGKLGFSKLQLHEFMDGSHPTESPLEVAASKLLKLLGFQEGKTLETSQFDLVFVHIGASEEINGQNDIEYVNALVGGLMHIAQPGSEIASRLHLSLVLSYGAVSEDDASLSVSTTNYYNESHLSLLVPRQSYTLKAGNVRKNVRDDCPMLIAQWQNAVTRKDMVETFSFQDFNELGGNLTIPADRFLHEVAFKLWKAPKYGA
ncbi:hypothetical protein RJ639_004589 [Escallonia herrerae]|uniref:Uncharacterized protein n=1 Tax=Escallonia herrerae TaxID=1293975 RepID=A0AA88W175_9ASTE|nr:hypothetical protein RJ639_004589 [Escallonia herrerae]